MTITFVAAATAANGAAPTSLSVARPTGTVDGDVMVACLAISADQTITAAPDGWAQIAQQATGTASGDCRFGVWTKTAAGEVGTYLWTFSAGADAAGVICTYHGTSGVQTSASQLMASSTTTMTAPSVTPSSTETLTVFAVAVNPVYDGNTTFTTPTGLTARAEADPGAGTTNRAVVKVWDASTPTTDPTGAKATTLNNSAKGIGYSVVLASSAATSQVISIESRAVA